MVVRDTYVNELWEALAFLTAQMFDDFEFLFEVLNGVRVVGQVDELDDNLVVLDHSVLLLVKINGIVNVTIASLADFIKNFEHQAFISDNESKITILSSILPRHIITWSISIRKGILALIVV